MKESVERARERGRRGGREREREIEGQMLIVCTYLCTGNRSSKNRFQNVGTVNGPADAGSFWKDSACSIEGREQARAERERDSARAKATASERARARAQTRERKKARANMWVRGLEQRAHARTCHSRIEKHLKRWRREKDAQQLRQSLNAQVSEES